MARRTPLLALALTLVLPAALAGCLGDAEEATPAATAEDANVTAPAGNAGRASAAAANATASAANATAAAAPVRVELKASSGGLYPLNPTESVDKDSIPSGAIVHVVYTNNDLNPLGKHNWALEGVSAATTDVVDPGETAEVEFVAPSPGTYAYYCSVEGHREAGMEGTLTVT